MLDGHVLTWIDILCFLFDDRVRLSLLFQNDKAPKRYESVAKALRKLEEKVLIQCEWPVSIFVRTTT